MTNEQQKKMSEMIENLQNSTQEILKIMLEQNHGLSNATMYDLKLMEELLKNGYSESSMPYLLRSIHSAILQQNNMTSMTNILLVSIYQMVLTLNKK